MPPQNPYTLEPSSERGQTLAEYAFLVSGIAIVVGVAIPLIGSLVLGMFTSLARAWPG